MLRASYLENTLRRVETIRATLDTKRLSPAIDTYLTSQRLAFVCTYQKIGQIYDESGERVISERIGATFAALRKEFALTSQQQCP